MTTIPHGHLSLGVLDRDSDRRLDADELGAATVAKLDANGDRCVSEAELDAASITTKQSAAVQTASSRFYSGLARSNAASTTSLFTSFKVLVASGVAATLLTGAAIALAIAVSALFLIAIPVVLLASLAVTAAALPLTQKVEHAVGQREMEAAREDMKQVWRDVANVRPMPPAPATRGVG